MSGLVYRSAAGKAPISERRLRDIVLKSLDWREQQRQWATLRRAIPTLLGTDKP